TNVSHFSNMQAVYSEKEKSFKVSGQAKYPDNTRLDIAIGYQGERLLINRESVTNGKFETGIPANKKVLPTAYDIEIIFWPQRPPASVTRIPGGQKFSEETFMLAVFTAAPKQVEQERRKNLEFFKKVLSDSKELYDSLKTAYLDEKSKPPQDFNMNDWEPKFTAGLRSLDKHRQTITGRQETYLSDIFPEINNLMLSFIQEVRRIYEELTEDLSQGGIIDVHTGRKIKTESIVNKADTAFWSYYEPLQVTVQLKERIGDENVILGYFRQLEGYYRALVNNYQDGLAQKITGDKWNDFVTPAGGGWNNKITDLKKQVEELQTKAATKELGDFYRDFKKLIDDVVHLSSLCGRHIKHESRDEANLIAEIEQKKLQFQKDFYGQMAFLGFQRIYIGRLSRPPALSGRPSEAAVSEETKQLIEKQIKLIKTSTEAAERETALLELTAIGPAIIPYFKQELSSSDKAAAAVFLRGLCFFGSEVAPLKPQLLEFLKSNNQELKLQA
ncbi:MAG: hypothetical protein AAB019_06975, partial [Planctomycetota bacterium]